MWNASRVACVACFYLFVFCRAFGDASTKTKSLRHATFFCLRQWMCWNGRQKKGINMETEKLFLAASCIACSFIATATGLQNSADHDRSHVPVSHDSLPIHRSKYENQIPVERSTKEQQVQVQRSPHEGRSRHEIQVPVERSLHEIPITVRRSRHEIQVSARRSPHEKPIVVQRSPHEKPISVERSRYENPIVVSRSSCEDKRHEPRR